MAIGDTNFTAACNFVREWMITQNQSLENEPRLSCNSNFDAERPAALQVLVDLPTCLEQWPGWSRSRLEMLSQWVGPLVGFLLPAIVFVLCIPRPAEFQMPQLTNMFKRSVMHAALGPMMVGAIHDGIKDWRLLQMIEFPSDGKSFTVEQKISTLALILIGTFEPSKGFDGQSLSQRVVRDICQVAPTVAQDKLYALLNQQASYGIQVGAPTIFYIGASIYALFDASSKKGDNDTAHAIAFGIWYSVLVLTATTSSAVLGISQSSKIEGIFGRQKNSSPRNPPYKPVWLWNRSTCLRSWAGDITLPDSLADIINSRGDRVLAAGLAIFAITLPCSLAVSVSYFTPIIGFGCRATTVLCYCVCQIGLIFCWLCHNNDETNPFCKAIVYILGCLFWAFAIFTSIGGTIMQLLGVYRNCICKAGLRYWVHHEGGVVDLAPDTQAHRDSGDLWLGIGSGGVTFIGLFCIFGWGYFMRMKAKLAQQIDALTPKTALQY
ncbi:hypothetical protein BGZ60DRAFT_562231 [Tricladium varicosporioides]|nr:hypothetical protein BGZ60DRAFT_562231 [Hymenoscyphus varicosporioides]